MSQPDLVVQKDESFTIDLESNPTTGYTWNVESDSDILSLTGKVFVPRKLSKAGSGGRELFTFTANSFGTTTLFFSYHRPWQSQAESVRDYNVTVSVE